MLNFRKNKVITVKTIVKQEITEEIFEPYISGACNVSGSPALFFHGTTKQLLKNISKNGFRVLTNRPTFSLSPTYSLAYCRKSESYLRGLITNNKKKELATEQKLLIKKGVISDKDLKDTKYQWWINKADQFYKKTIDITQSGVLLAFTFSKKVKPSTIPHEARLFLSTYKRKQTVTGAPSYWRTRQFSFPEATSLRPDVVIALNKMFVDSQ